MTGASRDWPLPSRQRRAAVMERSVKFHCCFGARPRFIHETKKKGGIPGLPGHARNVGEYYFSFEVLSRLVVRCARQRSSCPPLRSLPGALLFRRASAVFVSRAPRFPFASRLNFPGPSAALGRTRLPFLLFISLLSLPRSLSRACVCVCAVSRRYLCFHRPPYLSTVA